MSLEWLSLSVLAAVLLAATLCDLRTRRIPNALVVYGAALGLLLHAMAPAGHGLVAGGATGLPAALLGGVAGLALFLPFYALRLLGAGDVKLMAMVGIWLGSAAVLQAALWTMVAGGVLALLVAAFTGRLRQLLRSVFLLLAARGALRGVVRQQPASGVRLPYALAIAAGSAMQVALLLSKG